MAFWDKMLSNTITMSATSKYEGLQNILVVHLDGHLTTPDGRPDEWMDGRPDGRMDGRMTDKQTYWHIHQESRRTSTARIGLYLTTSVDDYFQVIVPRLWTLHILSHFEDFALVLRSAFWR